MKKGTERRRTVGVDVSLVLRFIATSFIYLLAGLLIFAMNLLGLLNLDRDAIFVLWLFGCVVMIIFGLSYMFSSGLARNSAMINSTVPAEYLLLNAGVIAFFVGFSGALSSAIGKPIAVAGLAAIMISVLVHLVNIVLIMVSKRTQNAHKQGFGDEY